MVYFVFFNVKIIFYLIFVCSLVNIVYVYNTKFKGTNYPLVVYVVVFPPFLEKSLCETVISTLDFWLAINYSPNDKAGLYLV